MKSFLLKNWIVIIFAFVVGLIHVGPNLVFTNLPEYQGIPMIYTDSEPYYLARINAASHGCIMSCNPYISEYSDDLPFFNTTN